VSLSAAKEQWANAKKYTKTKKKKRKGSLISTLAFSYCQDWLESSVTIKSFIQLHCTRFLETHSVNKQGKTPT
jgi:hypothetical protein